MFAINKSTLVACVAVLALASLVGAFEVKRCDDNKAIELLDLSVSSCADKKAAVCELPNGTEIRFVVKFRTSQAYEGRSYFTTLDLARRDGGFRRPATHQACNYQGLECPMEAGKTQTFHQHIHMNPDLASSTYRVGLMDPEQKQLLCVEFPTKMV